MNATAVEKLPPTPSADEVALAKDMLQTILPDQLDVRSGQTPQTDRIDLHSTEPLENVIPGCYLG